MNVSHLFAIQKVLDDRILAEHGLEGSDLFVKKIIALHVELGELANETRSFKYWSKKGPSPREIILEEFVDVLHFTLSLGIDLGCTDLSDALPVRPARRRDLTEQFAVMLTAISTLAATRAAKLGSATEEPEDEPWASATPVAGSSVAMPSGYSPSRGHTTSGWENRGGLFG